MGAGESARPLSSSFRQLTERRIIEVDRLIERAKLMKAMFTRTLTCQSLDAVECCGRILPLRKKGQTG